MTKLFISGESMKLARESFEEEHLAYVVVCRGGSRARHLFLYLYHPLGQTVKSGKNDDPITNMTQ